MSSAAIERRSYVLRYARPVWRAYLVLALIPIGLAPLLTTSRWGQTAVTATLGFSAALLCLWRYRTSRAVPGAWLWIGAGIALNASGSICEGVETQVLAVTATPRVADVLYLALYPCVTIGLLLIVRSRYRGLGVANLIDAGTLTVGMGLLCWVFLIGPSAASASGSELARVVNVAYPVGDLMLLAILAGAMAAEGWRTRSVRLMCFGLLAFLCGDTTWALVNQNGWKLAPAVEALLGDPFLLGFALLGAAALHPSTSELGDPATLDSERMSKILLAFLATASLVAPAILAAQAISGRVKDGVAIAICSAQLTALVVARMAYLLRNLQQQSARLRDLALEDVLTGLPNRRALYGYLASALQRADREGTPLSLAILDLDYFKQFNDSYGHLAGDQLLKAAASLWVRQLRVTDMLARIGGEEFVLVLPDAHIDEADAIVEKLRSSTPLGQTFSAGLAEWNAVASAEELLSAADAAMYQAKRAGRDRTESADGTVAARSVVPVAPAS